MNAATLAKANFLCERIEELETAIADVSKPYKRKEFGPEASDETITAARLLYRADYERQLAALKAEFAAL